MVDMRVLIVSQYFWPESFRINDLARSLNEKMVHIEVLTGKPNYPEGSFYSGYKGWGCNKELLSGITINRIPLLSRGKSAWRLALNYVSFVLSGLLVAPWSLRGKKFDVIFVYAPSPILQAVPAIFLGWLKGCPVVLWVQDLWPESVSATGYIGNRLILKLIEYVVRYIYRHVDLLLVQSEAFVEPIKELASGVPVIYYPNSGDEGLLTKTVYPTPEIPGFKNEFTVMFTGNIGAAQAVEVIIEAAAILQKWSDIQFVIVGDGSRREWMVQETKKLKLTNVLMPGKFPPETMPSFMEKASLLLVTLANQEIFGYTIPSKLQAYLAAGKPIVACVNGEGARVVEKSGAGLTAPAEDGRALAKIVLQMYNMSIQDREVMGSMGREYYASHFSRDILASRLVELLQSTCNDQ